MRKYILVLILGSSLFAESLDYKYDFGVRVEYDFTTFETEKKSETEGEVRRARVSHKGSFLDKTIFYETELDFADEVSFKDIYFGYKNKFQNIRYKFKFGNIKVPFSLETYSSSKYSPFMENSLIDTFTENRKLGSEISISAKNGENRTNLFLGIFKNSIDENIDDDEEKKRAVVKTTYGYKFEKKHKLHLGTSYMYSDFDGDNRRYKHKSEIETLENSFLNFNVPNVDSTHDFGLEALYINNSFHFQAEYIQSSIDANTDYLFNGFYAQAGFFINGGTRKFKLGEAKFSNSKNDNDLEIAFRYSNLDLTDATDVDNSQQDLNLALNWHINENFKFMTNYNLTYPSHYIYDGEIYSIQSRIMFIY